MSSPLFRAALALSLSAAALVTGCDLVAPSNPFDPAADEAVRARATIKAIATFDDGRAPEGIVVTALRAGTDEVLDTQTTGEPGAGEDGTVTLDVPSTSVIVRAAAPGFVAADQAFSLLPGDALTVELRLLPLPASARVTGVVVAEAPLSPSGVKVSLVETDADGVCRADQTAATTTTDGSGGYVFAAVRPGRYRVFAATAGALTILDDAFDVAEDAIVDRPALSLRGAADAVSLEVSGVVVAATDADDVDVTVLAQPGLDELRIGLDPAFDPALGATGFLPFVDETALSLPDADGAASVFVELRGPCGASPLYSESITVDRAPPLVLQASLNGTALALDDTQQVVLRDNAATARLIVTALDTSGLARIDVSGDIAGRFDVDAAAGQAQATVELPVPAAQGTYEIGIRAVDRAGNGVAVATARIVRDLDAPRTPIPVAARLETFGPRTLLWLEPQTGCPSGTEPFSCEAVPPAEGLFQVKGGAFLDFTTVAGPPFVVEVPADAVTRFEIRALDAAGNTSASTATIDVVRTATRVRFTAPTDREFGLPVLGDLDGVQRAGLDDPAVPPLVAQAGTAFFPVRPRVGINHATPYSVLVAQPADLGSLGLRYSTASFPRGLRRLALSGENGGRYARVAGGFGAGNGMLAWLEVSADDGVGAFPTQLTLGLDENGRFDLAGADLSFPSTQRDDEGESTVGVLGIGRESFNWNEACTRRGPARCTTDLFGWRGALGTQAPSMVAFAGDRIASPGLGGRIDALDGTATTPRTLAAGSFRLIAVALDAIETPGSLMNAIEVPITVPAGTPLHAGVFVQRVNNGPLLLEGDGEDLVTIVARGTGTELMPLPPTPLRSLFRGRRVLLGVIVPPEADATVDLVEIDSIGLITDLVPTGFVVHEGTDLADLESLATSDLVEDVTVTMPIRLFVPTAASGGAPATAGLAISEIGADLEPDGPGLGLAAFAERRGSLAAERRHFLPVAAPGVDTLTTANDSSLVVPSNDEACIVVVQAERDTPLESLTIDGAGLLNDVIATVFKSSTGRSTGLFVRDSDDFFQELTFESPTGASCSELSLETRLDEPVSQSIVAVDIKLDLEEFLDAPAVAVETPYNVRVQDQVVLLTRALTPGTVLNFFTAEDRDSVGDPDLLIEFDNGETITSDAFGPENRSLSVPVDATSVTVSLIAFGDDCTGDLIFTEYASPLFELSRSDLPADTERVRVVVQTLERADVRLLVRFDDAPTATEFDCESDIQEFFEVCELVPPPGATRVVVAAEFVDTSFGPGERFRVSTFMDSLFTPVEVARHAVSAGESFRATLTATAEDGPGLFVTLVDVDGAALVTCGDGNEPGASCLSVVPEGAVAAVVTLEPGSAPAETTVRSEIFAAGCDRVTADRSDFGSQVLRAGDTYAIVISDRSGDEFGWPASAPSIRRGQPATPDNRDVFVVGSVNRARQIASNKLVLEASDGGPVCQIDIGVQSRVSVTSPTVRGDIVAAALLDNGQSRVAFADLSEDAPTLRDLHLLDDGVAIAALSARADGAVVVVESDASALRVRAVGGPAGDDGCLLHEAVILPRGASFSTDGGAVVLFGDDAAGPAAIVLDLAGSVCAPATLRHRQRVPTTPLAAAIDGDDLFVMHAPAGSGGELLHVDLRSVELIVPAGVREIVGVTPLLDGRLIVAEAPRLSGDGVLRILTPATGENDIVHTGAVPFQPVRMGEIAVSVDVPTTRGAAPRIVAHPLDGGAPVELAPGTVLDAPGFDPLDARRLAREPIIASDGDRLAILGFTADGQRTLTIITLDGATETSRATLDGSFSVTPRSLTVSGSAVVVGDDGAGRAFVHDGTTLTPVELNDGERVLGAAGGDLLVALSPGDLFAVRPAATLRLLRRDPAGVVDDVLLGDTLPAAVFEHGITGIVDGGDQVLLLDDDASPAVVWRVGGGQAAVPFDGALRPVPSAAASLGRSALAAGYALRATETGTALYRVPLR